MHLKNPRGKPVKPPKVPFWKDHFVFDGAIVLELPPGTYTFEMETRARVSHADGQLSRSTAARPTPRRSR